MSTQVSSSARPRPARRGRARPCIRGLAPRAATALVALLLLGACGTPAPAASPPAAEAATPLPAATFTGGSASAALTAPEATSWSGGWCTRGAENAWLAVNIGDLNGSEYFGLVLGADPHADAAASPITGGGTFRGREATITWLHQGARFVVIRDEARVVLAPDLRTGSFSGTLIDGREVQGSFSCP